MKVGTGRRQAPALVVPPVLAWLAGHALYWAAAADNGFDYFLVRTHARWDSGNYLNIARHGYTLLRCVPNRPARSRRPTGAARRAGSPSTRSACGF